jgi:hypothetical protein
MEPAQRVSGRPGAAREANERVARGIIAVPELGLQELPDGVRAPAARLVGGERSAPDPEVPGLEPDRVAERYRARVDVPEERDRDRELVDARQEERLVATGRRTVAGLQMDDGRADLALELRGQPRDLGLERVQGRVGGCRREIDRSQAAENGDQRSDRQGALLAGMSRPDRDRSR